MILIFSRHALKRMRSRAISRSTVESVVGAPDNIVRKAGYSIAAKRLNGKVVLVIYKELNNMLFIITTISSSKVEKYLKGRSV